MSANNWVRSLRQSRPPAVFRVIGLGVQVQLRPSMWATNSALTLGMHHSCFCHGLQGTVRFSGAWCLRGFASPSHPLFQTVNRPSGYRSDGSRFPCLGPNQTAASLVRVLFPKKGGGLLQQKIAGSDEHNFSNCRRSVMVSRAYRVKSIGISYLLEALESGSIQVKTNERWSYRHLLRSSHLVAGYSHRCRCASVQATLSPYGPWNRWVPRKSAYIVNADGEMTQYRRW